MSDEIKGMIEKLEKNMNDRLTKQDEMMQQLLNMVEKNNERLERIEESVNRIEQNEPADIMAMLKQIDSKLDEKDYDLQALNKRLFKTESEIERLNRQ